MLVIRDVFQCKPGKAKVLVSMMKATISNMEREGITGARVMTDLVANYWTVVLETTADDLKTFEEHFQQLNTGDVRKPMEGYMDLVEGGHREIYRVE